ncbi:hypothetical protein [Streptomyces griseoruber]|uniref:Uncharacterized protein n=1 Tax=Streptomyces griseoruber TaxID=1943 RepID=A0A117RCC9_9ACTN|nr:hypothetical protein [Streptomyces griseoruber]KUN82916.1 hypothetical protein AQJ64_18230 [Streptomyces griseoruber]
MDAFLRAEDARVPRWSARTKDALGGLAILTAALLALWFAVQMPIHPAEQALDAEQRGRLERSTRDPAQEAKNRDVWIDSGGGC